MADLFHGTVRQRILHFLSVRSTQSLFDKEISEKTGISRGATNTALRDLAKLGLVECKKRGRMSFYSVNHASPVIRHWKVLGNILSIYRTVEQLKGISDKIILFGSAADGTNVEESDIDLFVLTNTPEKVRKAVVKSRPVDRLQVIVRKPLEFVELERRDPIFYGEVNRGIMIWERRE